MNKIVKETSFDFISCKLIWFLFLTEYNWNPQAISPLEIVPESFWSEVIDLLIEAKYMANKREFFLENLINKFFL